MLIDGYKARVEAERELVAWHACNVMNVHLKRKVTIKKLLGKDKQMTPFDRAKELEKLNRALCEKGGESLGADGRGTSS